MSDLVEQFTRFDAANPAVFELFERFAREAKAAGRDHFSADAILHRIRWETAIVTRADDDTKINNNFAAFYARKLLAEQPSFKGFFRLRTSAADLMVAA